MNNIVAVTLSDPIETQLPINYSTDGGNTWLQPNNFPDILFGRKIINGQLGGRSANAVAYGYDETNNTCFVGVGIGPGVIGYSKDGSIWTLATAPAKIFDPQEGGGSGGGGGYGICYGKDTNGNNCFIAVGCVDIARSTDGGKTWTKITPLNAGLIYGNLFGIAYGNGTFVAVGGYNTTTSNFPTGVYPRAVYYSTDGGLTWIQANTNLFSSGNLSSQSLGITSGTCVAYGYDENNVGCFVAGGTAGNTISGQLGYSPDGITWSVSNLTDKRTGSILFNGLGDSIDGIAYDSANKRFVITGQTNSNSSLIGLICYSYDGGKTVQTFADNFNNTIVNVGFGVTVYNNSLFVIGQNGSQPVISSSTDNVNWSPNKFINNYYGLAKGIASSNVLPPPKPSIILDPIPVPIPSPIPSPIPTSNICFPAGTPVQTDQGIVNIEKLDKFKHTIQGERILHVTKTVTIDPYLICFNKNSISRNIPNKTTVMTKDHNIEFNGKIVPAYRLLDYSSDIKKVKYSGEVLYNVLLNIHGFMKINNLICETLDPDNVIAKLYTNNYNETERNDIIIVMNETLKNKNLVEYKSVINFCKNYKNNY
jgi:hypothetical protein